MYQSRGVEHDYVVTLFTLVLVDVHHGAELFHAGQDRKLLGLDPADPGSAQDRGHVGRDLLPMTLDLLLNIELLDPEPVTDRQRVGSLEVKEVGIQIEGVSQAMCRVDAHD
jgi:hypothetical protein